MTTGNPALSELQVLVVDCQTTGASPALGSVLELGWCLTRADDDEPGAAQAHWIHLAPGQRVSATVRQLTGFQDSVLDGALAAEDAWARLRRLMSGPAPMPSAIHFARFELAFLQDWSGRFEPGLPFPMEAVCVHAIAVRLFPDLPRRNLRALAGFLGHGLHLERRALGHVQATAFIWKKLVAELSLRGIATWPALLAWLALPSESKAQRKRRYPLPPTRYRSLPEQPGVYRFLRSNGDVLYVGKATSLKKRVSSHFTKQAGATERALEMLTQVSDIAFTATASALEAALLETQTIKSLNPPYNVQLVQGDRGVWFSCTNFVSASPEPDAEHRLGPLSSRFSLRALGVLVSLLAGAPATDARRAAAVGAPTRWGPDAASFADGFASFSARHVVPVSAALPARQRALRIGRALLAQVPEEPAAEPESNEPKVWDGPRVARHLERALGQAYQVLRRAAWLCLLASSSVGYREPGATVTRFLMLRRAVVVETGDLPAGTTLPCPSLDTRLLVQRSFDAAGYDALRILSTELKRILRDGGEVEVRLSRSRTLRGAALANVLRVT